MVNKAHYSGKELSTATAVPGRLLGRHEEYAELTNEPYILDTVQHGYSKHAITILASLT